LSRSNDLQTTTLAVGFYLIREACNEARNSNVKANHVRTGGKIVAYVDMIKHHLLKLRPDIGVCPLRQKIHGHHHRREQFLSIQMLRSLRLQEAWGRVLLFAIIMAPVWLLVDNICMDRLHRSWQRLWPFVVQLSWLAMKGLIKQSLNLITSR
jgi:hypothetical protein